MHVAKGTPLAAREVIQLFAVPFLFFALVLPFLARSVGGRGGPLSATDVRDPQTADSQVLRLPGENLQQGPRLTAKVMVPSHAIGLKRCCILHGCEVPTAKGKPREVMLLGPVAHGGEPTSLVSLEGAGLPAMLETNRPAQGTRASAPASPSYPGFTVAGP
ncbi:hypothetical protein CB1_001214001 [Camelus ferus]|nr:hypothetical protein CB1_001214001 [Camelus ferus]